MAEEKLLLLKNIRKSGYKGTLADYRKTGGFTALDKALKQMKPEAVQAVVKDSGLRGRGGAGFPTGVKWGFMPKDTGKPSYLVCNADEAEPGTFKDHLLINEDVHMFLEGMIVSCYAVDCHHGYIYIRGESMKSAKHLQQAIDELYKEGLLGKNILGTGYDLDMTVHRGAGAYICGEETALLESLEGKRGQPRVKPPFPAVAGYNGCPTSVNNVETLATVPWIVNEGAEAYKALGTPNNAGTHLVSISGHVKQPGVYEVELGVSLRSLIYDYAGGIRGDKQLKAVVPGGASSPVLTADEIDVPYDFDSLVKAGTMMGSAAPMVYDEDTDIVELAYRTTRFFDHESCGQCTPCREGNFWLKNLIRDFLDDGGDESKMSRVKRVAGGMIGTTLCPFGDAAGMPTVAFVQKFPEEFRKHFP